MKLLAALGAGLLVAACAVPPPPSAPPPIDDAATLARLRAASFVLLGEVHDNAAQHQRRAALLRELLADGRPTLVVFEQMERGREDAIAAAPREPEAVASAGHLDRKGWGWPLHEPIVAAALAGGARITGGNLDTGQVRAVVRGGATAVPPDLQPSLADPSWTSSQQAELEHQIDIGHCGALPRSQWAPMALAQRTRDAAMAQALLHSAPGERAVLIAGNGHVRGDLGVPHYLRAAGVPAGQIVSVGFVEDGGGDAARYDLTQRTAAAVREDPCAGFPRD